MKPSPVPPRHVLCVRPEMSLDDAQALMALWATRHLLIVRDGRLVGLLSEQDLLRGLARHRSGRVPVSADMIVHPAACRLPSSAAEVAGLMLDRGLDAVPLVDEDGRPVGLVTAADLLELLRGSDAAASPGLPFRYQVHGDVVRRARAAA